MTAKTRKPSKHDPVGQKLVVNPILSTSVPEIRTSLRTHVTRQ